MRGVTREWRNFQLHTKTSLMCIMCVYKREPVDGARCETVYMPLCPGNSRYPAGRDPGRTRGGEIVDRLPGIPIIAVIPAAPMTPPPFSSRPFLPLDSRACLRSPPVPFPQLVNETCTRDDSSSTTGSAEHSRKKIVVGDRRRNNEISDRLVSGSPFLRNIPHAKRNVPGVRELFFICTHD